MQKTWGDPKVSRQAEGKKANLAGIFLSTTIASWCRIENVRRDQVAAAEKQINYAMALLAEAGYSTRWMNAQYKTLGAALPVRWMHRKTQRCSSSRTRPPRWPCESHETPGPGGTHAGAARASFGSRGGRRKAEKSCCGFASRQIGGYPANWVTPLMQARRPILGHPARLRGHFGCCTKCRFPPTLGEMLTWKDTKPTKT